MSRTRGRDKYIHISYITKEDREDRGAKLFSNLNTVLSIFLTLKRAGLLALLSVCKYYTGEFFLQNLITLDQSFN